MLPPIKESRVVVPILRLIFRHRQVVQVRGHIYVLRLGKEGPDAGPPP